MIEGALAGVATTALTEGIRFLYQQAQELIGSWRADRAAEVTEAPPPVGVFLGELRLVPDDPAVLDEHAGAFDTLLTSPGLVRLTLGHAVAPDNEEQMRAAVALRALLETVSGRRITFVGESGRDTSGTTVVRGEAEANEVGEGALQAGVDADEIESGADVTGRSKTGKLEKDAKNYGVKARKISG
ncbi:hypothetical protein [Streptomyces mirabilis]|uniref:hypothetical protein n=1 Tax=Streptomyces mirabilis TaxID=68239 RepID=UPI00331A86E8